MNNELTTPQTEKFPRLVVIIYILHLVFLYMLIGIIQSSLAFHVAPSVSIYFFVILAVVGDVLLALRWRNQESATYKVGVALALLPAFAWAFLSLFGFFLGLSF